jgi:hypothetical protein
MALVERNKFGLNDLLGRQCASETRLPATPRLNRSPANRALPRNPQPDLTEAACLGRKTNRKPPNVTEAEQRQATRNRGAPDRLAEAEKMLSEAGDDMLPQTPLPNAFQRPNA